ncbi:isoamylase early set domain-containing protein [bacterium]|nr:isoamylase early set domain-containing protein [bacterium]
MIKKQYVKSRKVAKLTFKVAAKELPEGIDVKTLHVVGDFNDWNRAATPMKKSKGVFSTTIEVAPGATVRFRYLANDSVWFNDWKADEYLLGEEGEDNSVVTAPDAPSA